jgi:hypothetical protein
MTLALGSARPRLRPTRGTRLKRTVLILTVAALGYLLWPYLALWGLSHAVADADPANLANRINLAAVRDEIRRKLNKDAQSDIDTLSDPFLQWLGSGIHRLGTRALDEMITQAWVQERLGVGAPHGQTLLSRVTYAFFDAPFGFAVRLGPGGAEAADQTQVHLRMTLEGFRWVVTAVYY